MANEARSFRLLTEDAARRAAQTGRLPDQGQAAERPGLLGRVGSFFRRSPEALAGLVGLGVGGAALAAGRGGEGARLAGVGSAAEFAQGVQRGREARLRELQNQRRERLVRLRELGQAFDAANASGLSREVTQGLAREMAAVAGVDAERYSTPINGQALMKLPHAGAILSRNSTPQQRMEAWEFLRDPKNNWVRTTDYGRDYMTALRASGEIAEGARARREVTRAGIGEDVAKRVINVLDPSGQLEGERYQAALEAASIARTPSEARQLLEPALEQAFGTAGGAERSAVIMGSVLEDLFLQHGMVSTPEEMQSHVANLSAMNQADANAYFTTVTRALRDLDPQSSFVENFASAVMANRVTPGLRAIAVQKFAAMTSKELEMVEKAVERSAVLGGDEGGFGMIAAQEILAAAEVAQAMRQGLVTQATLQEAENQAEADAALADQVWEGMQAIDEAEEVEGGQLTGR